MANALSHQDGTPATFTLSPQTLRIDGCRCLQPRDPPSSAIATIDYMLRRMDKLWSRMRGSRLDGKVKMAGERLLLDLRGQNMELFHLVGREMGLKRQGDKSREELSIVLMVPDWGAVDIEETAATDVEGGSGEVPPAAETSEDRPKGGSAPRTCAPHVNVPVIECGFGHRIIAELLVYLHTDSQRKTTVERVDTRLAHDWSDYISIVESTYFRASGEPPPVRIDIPFTEVGSRQAIHPVQWRELFARMDEGWRPQRPEMNRKITKALGELNQDGKVVTGFEVETVQRKVDEKKYVPTVRVALLVKDRSEVHERGKEGEGDQPSGDDRRGQATNGAVVLIESKGSHRSQIKHIMVAYEGEWPVVHRYKDKAKAPDLSRLEEMITV